MNLAPQGDPWACRGGLLALPGVISYPSLTSLVEKKPMERNPKRAVQTVGVYEAKSRLSELIEEVEAGGEVLITRHGIPVARLVPSRESTEHARGVAETLDALRALSAKFPRDLTLEELREYRAEGRR